MLERVEETLTDASLSKRANSSFSSIMSSWALHAEDSWVKPTISAKRILNQISRDSIVKDKTEKQQQLSWDIYYDKPRGLFFQLGLGDKQ